MLEDIVRQIQTLLQDQLPAKLDQIELERADGVTLEDVQSFFIQLSHKDARTKYPSITIIGEFTVADNALSHMRELIHKVSIMTTVREVSPDIELAQVKLWRYIEAIERVIASDPTLNGKAVNSTVTGHAYHRKEEGEFIRNAMLIIEVLERSFVGNS
ncbi:MAG: hypothetical protein GY800_04445 [Planctomycetes bacterium]|nr:hypothetical protein [Planctomycetota bacterium]